MKQFITLTPTPKLPPAHQLRWTVWRTGVSLIAAVLIGITSAGAATIYVAKDGSGNYSTIQAAANVAVAGDSVLVKAGTYNEYVTVMNSGTAGNPITFKAIGTVNTGYTATSTFPVTVTYSWNQMPSETALFQITGKQFIVIDGFHTIGGYFGINVNSTWGSTSGFSSDVIIRNNYVENPHAHGILAGYWRTDRITIENNIINRYTPYDGSGSIVYSEMITNTHSHNSIIRNNHIMQNSVGEGIMVKSSGIPETASSFIQVYNNLVENTRGNIQISGDNVHDVEAYNNISLNSYGGPDPWFPGGNTGIYAGVEGGGTVSNISIHDNWASGNYWGGIGISVYTGNGQPYSLVNISIYNNQACNNGGDQFPNLNLASVAYNNIIPSPGVIPAWDPGGGDTQAPTVPTGLASSNITQTSFTLSWTASTDNVLVTGYEVFKNGTSIGTTASTSMPVAGLTASTTYAMTVRARDAVPYWSAQSIALNVVTTSGGGTALHNFETDLNGWTDGRTGSSLIFGRAATQKHNGSYSLNIGALYGRNYRGTGTFTEEFVLSNASSADVSAWLYIPPNTSYQTYNYVRLHNGTSYVNADLGKRNQWQLVSASASPAGTVKVSYQIAISSDLWSGSDISFYIDDVDCGDTQAPTVPTGLASSNITQTSFTLSWTASTDNVLVTGYEVFNNGTSIGTTASTSMPVTGLTASTTYAMTVRARDAVPYWSAQSIALNVVTTSGGGTTYTVITAQTPANSGTDGPFELGMKFKSAQAGQITKIRFYKYSGETAGTHTGRLWSSDGAQLASVVFSGETSSGWQEAALSTPYSISANTTYVVSVNASTSAIKYGGTINGLASAITNGPLSSIAGSNGVFGTVGTFPTSTYSNSNYFRDVVFSSGSGSLFSDNFNDGNYTGWTVDLSSWAVIANVLAHNSGGDNRGEIRVTGANFTNGTIEAKCQHYTVNSDWGITFRGTNYSNCYTFLFENGNLYLRKAATTISSTAFIPAIGSWYTLKVIANGSSIKCYRDGNLVFDATDTQYSSGFYGLHSWADARFDDFSVIGDGIITYSISGTVSGATAPGVTMTLSGAGTGTQITDASGNYAFSGLANGTYTLTPSKSGYTFSPTSTGVTINGASQTGKNFTATASSGASYALNFDGIDDYARAANATSLNPATGITVETWFNATSGSLSQQISVVGKAYTSHEPPYYQYMLGLLDNATYPKTAMFYLSIGGVLKELVQSNLTYGYGAWHHLAGTYDGTTMRLYLNGVQVNSLAVSGSISSYSTPLDIGRYTNYNAYYKGKIDEVRVVNRALSAAEIAADAAGAPYPSVSGTVAWYHMDENTGTAISDASGSGNSGTVTSATWVAGMGVKTGGQNDETSSVSKTLIVNASILYCTPNPSHSGTVIHVMAERAGQVSIKVYDITGKLVRTICDQLLAAGYHSVAWDGKDTNGSKVAAGVYLYRMQAGEYSKTNKMTVLR